MTDAGGPACRLPGGGAPENAVAKILSLKTFAVVGCSPKPERPSHYVAAYLRDEGYTIIPVNPGQENVLGLKCYPSVTDIPFPVDVVVVFRRSEEALEPIQQAIAKKARAVWLQDGITHHEGEELARKAGLLVVSDDCVMRRHMKTTL